MPRGRHVQRGFHLPVRRDQRQANRPDMLRQADERLRLQECFVRPL
mgnify:CR=1 FL=1